MAKKSEENKKSFWNPFSRLELDGPGVEKGETPILDEPSFKNFFKMLWRKLNQVASLNLLAVVCNFPVFFLLLFIAGFFSASSTAPVHTVFANLNGIITLGDSSASVVSNMVGIFGVQTSVTVHSTVDYVLLGLSALLFFTFGPVMAGCTYIARGFVRQEPTFLFRDFFYAIKKNLKQALIFGILDLLIIVLIAYDIFFFNLNYTASIVTMMLFFGALCLAAIYFLMRTYVYMMMVTFDLKITKMLKNALILSVLGIKRNIAMLLGSVAAVLINVFLLAVYFPIGVILPFVILPSLLINISVYCGYPVVKKVMIDPYYKDENNAEE